MAVRKLKSDAKVSVNGQLVKLKSPAVLTPEKLKQKSE